jgi:hypothetical protein
MDSYGGDTFGGANTLRTPGTAKFSNIAVVNVANPQVKFNFVSLHPIFVKTPPPGIFRRVN